ncbi:xylosidase glycosyl hydrolase [Fusarium beomiforme]|uniref:Xylosidase glycosyl hydrolase n=1 Tax=Fusarium beomiforme TaxID=44412 RepID=A0A9P5AGH0_9HYPO|nr:xylosidase glycosyl hydrolase [Fusarium beomiforme]
MKLFSLAAWITTVTPALAGLVPRATTFNNPIIYSDFPDNDVFLGPDNYYYFSASNFHFSPGAPILKSKDLLNWDLIGHSIPRFVFGDGYDLPPGGRSYRGGTWASSLRYRKSNGQWYWIGCINFWQTWVYTASSPEGPWYNKGNFGDNNCYYDNGILIDDDDTMYVVYGSKEVRVAQLSQDGFSQVKTQLVLKNTDIGVEDLEGNRMYKINGLYYILNDNPSGSQTWIWKSKSPWGPYESKILADKVNPPISGGSSPNQGSLIKTPSGDWYFMSFTWAYPAGRLPVLAPITWGSDGFPILVKGANGGWGSSYPTLPGTNGVTKNWTRTDTFPGTSLAQSWEWNHNPDVNSFTVNNGLTLRTASVTNDIFQARNTLSHRTHGNHPTGIVKIDFSQMKDGDRAGLSAFRDQSAYIGIHRDNGTFKIATKHGMTQDEWDGHTTGLGEVKATAAVPSGKTKIWLRLQMDTDPTGTGATVFSYSWDGVKYETLGPNFKLYNGWAFFIAYRFGIFNYAETALGGSIKVESFTAA